MRSIAIIVLNYNTPEMTDKLARYLRDTLEYPDKDIYVIDNGSQIPPACTTHPLPKNLGFTLGMAEGHKIASQAKNYDAYWFLNSDISFDDGNRVLLDLVDVLFSNPDFAQIAPQHNSPHAHMRAAIGEAVAVPFLEATAPLVKASTIQKLGFWDLDCTLGFGVDYDYGYRIRQAGMANIVTNRARIVHQEHASQTNKSDYAARAKAEMNTVLTRKYGPDWTRIKRMEPAETIGATRVPRWRAWIQSTLSKLRGGR